MLLDTALRAHLSWKRGRAGAPLAQSRASVLSTQRNAQASSIDRCLPTALLTDLACLLLLLATRPQGGGSKGASQDPRRLGWLVFVMA